MFRVLSAHGEDAATWDRYIEALPYDLRDVHFTAAWGRAHEAHMGGTAHLAVLEEDGEATMQAFMLRPIGVGFLTDIAAAGYGGIVTTSALPDFWHCSAFENAMVPWRMAHHVVSEFYLINPVFAAHQGLMSMGRSRRVKDVVLLHVGPPEELRRGMKATRRHAEAKAGGVRLHLMTGQESKQEIAKPSVAGFAALYESAMKRKGASDRWRLGVEYFAGLCHELGDNVLLTAAGEGGLSNPEAVGLFTFGKSVAYYHLAAAIDRPNPGLADALIITAAEYARSRGCDWLHLGGGVTAAPDDSLLAYKRSFGGLQRTVYGVQRIHKGDAYADLAAHTGADPASDFFPAYRAKEAQAA